MDTSLADIAAVTRTNDGCFGGGAGIWLFALLILFGMGGNGFWGNRGLDGRTATVEDVNNSANFTRLEQQVRDNAQLIDRTKDVLSNGLCDGFYTTAQKINDVNMNVMESRYLNEKATADSTAQVIAAISGLSQKLDQNKIDALQAKVSELQIQNMFCGVPRINPFAYGVYPYATGCGSAGNI